CGFDSYYPCHMAVVAKWLTHRIVAPAFVGSIPIIRPILGYSQAVRQRVLVSSCEGSNPSSPVEGAIAKGQGRGLQTLYHRFKSGWRLQFILMISGSSLVFRICFFLKQDIGSNPIFRSIFNYLIMSCHRGGIGRRAGLKIQFPLRECWFDPGRWYFKLTIKLIQYKVLQYF